MHEVSTDVDSRWDYGRRKALYLAMMEIATLFKQMPGGRDATLVGMAVALGSMAGMPVNVSSVADMVDINRKKARRLLDGLEAGGFIYKKPHRSGWSVYEKSLDVKTQGFVEVLVNQSYSILRKHLFDYCASSECGEKCPHYDAAKARDHQ